MEEPASLFPGLFHRKIHRRWTAENTRWKLALVFLSLCKHFHAVASYFD